MKTCFSCTKIIKMYSSHYFKDGTKGHICDVCSKFSDDELEKILADRLKPDLYIDQKLYEDNIKEHTCNWPIEFCKFCCIGDQLLKEIKEKYE